MLASWSPYHPLYIPLIPVLHSSEMSSLCIHAVEYSASLESTT